VCVCVYVSVCVCVRAQRSTRKCKRRLERTAQARIRAHAASTDGACLTYNPAICGSPTTLLQQIVALDVAPAKEL